MVQQKKCILVAEDDLNVLKVTKLRLEHEGYDVLTSTDGEAAVQQATGHLPIHLILLDVKLPRMSGYDVCRVLKHQPATEHIPVIVFSASESQFQQMADRCIEVGATDWIKKPFQTRDLMAKIHRALGEQEGGVHG